MEQEELFISEHDSTRSKTTKMVVSAQSISNRTVALVVGWPGAPNRKGDFRAGDAVLFDTLEGLFEVRVLSVSSVSARILLSKLAPRPALLTGVEIQDATNRGFTEEDLRRLGESVDQIKQELAERLDVSPAQLTYIGRQLDEIASAAERMGRKDWILLTLGMLTNIISGLALEPNKIQVLLAAVDTGFAWLLGAAVRLLSS